MQPQVDPTTEACSNCGSALAGPYCSVCGQRRLQPQDRRFAHLLREFFEHLTDLDGRFWGSMRALLLRPGLLSRDWMAGRRTRWMSPVSLFLLANLLFFFAPGVTDFDLPLRDHVSGAVLADHDPAKRDLTPEQRAALAQGGGGQLHSPLTDAWVRHRLDALAQERPGAEPFDILQRRYAIASANISKALIILHVPCLALVLMLGMAGSGRYFAEHFVVALHYFAFVLFLSELVVLPGMWITQWLGMHGMPVGVRLGLALVVCVYGIVAVRRAYDATWWRAALLGPVLLVGLIAANLSVYRALQFVVVMAMA